MNFPEKQSPERKSWREYQKKLKRRRRLPSTLKIALVAAAAVLIGWGLVRGAAFLKMPDFASVAGLFGTPKNIAGRLDPRAFTNLRQPSFAAEVDGKTYRVETSLDPLLQNALLSKMEEITAKERYCSRFVSILVMKADSGKVLSMISFDKLDKSRNTCVEYAFPAASIFKIVTAAAAIETQGLSAGSPINFTGRKHTLFRGQLKDAAARYTTTLTLEEAFAQSINPVFGKIGVDLLGKKVLEEYASRFGFNQPIEFDLPVAVSRMAVGEDKFEQAEIASGYNTQTTMSTLHGAMICAALLNGGTMKPPVLVERISNPSTRVVYEGSPKPARRVISERASAELYKAMQATVYSGTARKVFRGANKNPVLNSLVIGGKTGSIHDNPRYDWFVGFAADPRTGDAIVVSSMVAHEDFIGERAGRYAMIAMESYFSRNSTPAAVPTSRAKRRR